MPKWNISRWKCFTEGIGKLTHVRRFVIVTVLFGLMFQCLNAAIPSRDCSINAPTEWRTSVYVLKEICHQTRSKWLCSKRDGSGTQSITSKVYAIQYEIPLSNAFVRAKLEPPDWCGGPNAKSYSTLFVNSRIAFLRLKNNNITRLEIFGN